MRRIALSATSALVLSALLGGFTASYVTQAATTAPQHALATEVPAGVGSESDNHGND